MGELPEFAFSLRNHSVAVSELKPNGSASSAAAFALASVSRSFSCLRLLALSLCVALPFLFASAAFLQSHLCVFQCCL